MEDLATEGVEHEVGGVEEGEDGAEPGDGGGGGGDGEGVGPVGGGGGGGRLEVVGGADELAPAHVHAQQQVPRQPRHEALLQRLHHMHLLHQGEARTLGRNSMSSASVRFLGTMSVPVASLSVRSISPTICQPPSTPPLVCQVRLGERR